MKHLTTFLKKSNLFLTENTVLRYLNFSAIEVDGSIHFEEGQQEKDAYRQKRLESLSVNFIRFNDLDVKDNLNWVLSVILHIPKH